MGEGVTRKSLPYWSETIKSVSWGRASMLTQEPSSVSRSTLWTSSTLKPESTPAKRPCILDEIVGRFSATKRRQSDREYSCRGRRSVTGFDGNLLPFLEERYKQELERVFKKGARDLRRARVAYSEQQRLFHKLHGRRPRDRTAGTRQQSPCLSQPMPGTAAILFVYTIAATNARLSCSYHAWTYTDGALTGVPGLRDAYRGEFDRGKLGLIEVRTTVYGGLIFACWDAGAVSLENYLGDAKWWLDNFLIREELGGLGK